MLHCHENRSVADFGTGISPTSWKFFIMTKPESFQLQPYPKQAEVCLFVCLGTAIFTGVFRPLSLQRLNYRLLQRSGRACSGAYGRSGAVWIRTGLPLATTSQPNSELFIPKIHHFLWSSSNPIKYNHVSKNATSFIQSNNILSSKT